MPTTLLGLLLGPTPLLPALILFAAAVRGQGPAASDPPEPVTFTTHIAPIVFAHCTSCHRPGEAAPFPLRTYDEVRRKGKMIARVTGSRKMPPWHAEPGHLQFADQRGLTDEQIAQIAAWVQAGMPEGDPQRLPPLPEFTPGWQLGEPDLVVSMPEPYVVRAAGPDIYRHFVLPLDLDEDRWVTAVELRPSARAVVHHSLFFLDDSGDARRQDARDDEPGFFAMGFRRSGSLGGWAVGRTPRHLPGGLAMPLPKGSDLVLQTHFHPTGKEEREQTTVGLYFADRAPEHRLFPIQLPPLFGIMAGLDIPAGEADFKIADSFVLPVAVEAVLIGGHAHYVCKSMRATATPPGGKPVPLLSIPAWDFGWQDVYEYAVPVKLPAQTVLDFEIRYDNSAANPDNPHSPPQRITWGPESTDEMGSLTLTVVAANDAEHRELERAYRRHVAAATRGAGGQLRSTLAKRLAQLDQDGDGRVVEAELPPAYRRLFARLDRNRDGALDSDEWAAIGAWLDRRGR